MYSSANFIAYCGDDIAGTVKLWPHQFFINVDYIILQGI